MTTFISCIILKKTTARDRPILSGPARIKDLRGKEICNSWPSGDTAQASALAAFMLLNFSADVEQRFIFGKWSLALMVL